MKLPPQHACVTACGNLFVITDGDDRLVGVALHDRSNDRFSVSMCGEDAARAAVERRNELQRQWRRERKTTA